MRIIADIRILKPKCVRLHGSWPRAHLFSYVKRQINFAAKSHWACSGIPAFIKRNYEEPHQKSLKSLMGKFAYSPKRTHTLFPMFKQVNCVMSYIITLIVPWIKGEEAHL